MAKRSMKRKRTSIRRQRKTPQSKKRFGRRKFYKRKSRFSRKARTRNRGRKSLSGGSGTEGVPDGSGLAARFLPDEMIDEIIDKHLDSVLRNETAAKEKKVNVKAKIMENLEKSPDSGRVEFIGKNIERMTDLAIDELETEETEEYNSRYGVDGESKYVMSIYQMIARGNWEGATKALKVIPVTDTAFMPSIMKKLNEQFNSQVTEAMEEAPQKHADAIVEAEPTKLTISEWIGKIVTIHSIDPDLYLLSGGRPEVARIGSLKNRLEQILISHAGGDVTMENFKVEGLQEALAGPPKVKIHIQTKLWRRLYIELGGTLGLEALPSDDTIVKQRVGTEFAATTPTSFTYV
jgi:hypothetical protein